MFEPLELLPLHVLIRLGLWMPNDLNWWIGMIFAFGSALFVAGSAVAINLMPVAVRSSSMPGALFVSATTLRAVNRLLKRAVKNW